MLWGAGLTPVTTGAVILDRQGVNAPSTRVPP
jgi:hypothetical protein